MSTSNTTQLSVEMTAELQKIVAEATSPEAIRAAVAAEAERQAAVKQQADADNKTAAEKAAADKLAAEQHQQSTEPAFKRVVTIGGRELEFEAATELELFQSINNAYAVFEATRPDQSQTVTAQVDPTVAAKQAADKAAADLAAKTDLELKFRRGEIPVDQYLRESGAMDNYLASQGLSVATLKATVEKSQNDSYTQSWTDATNEFLKDPTNDWPGGSRNKEILGMTLASLDLHDADDKVGAIRQAYAEMKRRNLVFVETAASAEQQAATTTPAAKTNAEIAAEKAAHDAEVAATAFATRRLTKPIPSQARQSVSSGMFGASSGTFSSGASAGAEVKLDIPKDAQPEEILEAWKAAQIAKGVNPNEAFMDTFRARRV